MSAGVVVIIMAALSLYALMLTLFVSSCWYLFRRFYDTSALFRGVANALMVVWFLFTLLVFTSALGQAIEGPEKTEKTVEYKIPAEVEYVPLTDPRNSCHNCLTID